MTHFLFVFPLFTFGYLPIATAIKIAIAIWIAVAIAFSIGVLIWTRNTFKFSIYNFQIWCHTTIGNCNCEQ